MVFKDGKDLQDIISNESTNTSSSSSTLEKSSLESVEDGVSDDYLSTQLQQISKKIKSCLQPITWSIEVLQIELMTSHFKLDIEAFEVHSEGSKLTITLNNSNVHSSTPLTDEEVDSHDGLCHRVLRLSYFRLIIDRELKEHNYLFGDDIYFQWNTLFHLTVINLIRNYKKLTKCIASTEANGGTDNRVEESGKPTNLIHINMTGNIEIGALLSAKGQTLCFKLSSASFVRPAKGRFSFKSSSVSMYCEDNLIATFDKNKIVMMPESESKSVLNRSEFVGAKFEMTKNRVLLVSIEKVIVTFPYKYDFAGTFNEKFITITKWLRKFHSSPSTTSVQSVSCDLVVKIKLVALELEDDLFEVRLRNNYELLEDEFKESLKRQQSLMETINRLRMTGSVVSEKAVKKMKDDLEVKKYEIYIKRHKQLYEHGSPRKYNIFTVQARDVHVQFAADESMTGHDELIRIMREELDPVSPFPEGLKFSTIWCRHSRGTISSLVCRLRDFPQPWMEITSFSLCGRIMAAEQEPTARARREAYVDLFSDFDPICVERTMPTRKIYHDIKIRTASWTYTHGATWEPVLAQMSLCFESVVKPSTDPSPALPWWDKMRFLFHGNMSVESQQLSLFFHGSLDPYNSTELIEIGFFKSIIDWLPGRILLRGNVDLLVHTASKYDECRIVHLPHIEAQFYLYWQCLGNPFDHHSVIPCAANKIPEYSSNQQHDSYRAFRSQALNLKVSLESKPSNNTIDLPSILLFSSSLRWFENQKQIFAGITRLTRRGPLFKNTKPRKKQFSKIFHKISVSVCLHKLRTTYWSSFNHTYGCEIIGGLLSHGAQHTLSLAPFDDGLHRRPRPVWSMTYMNSEISDVEIWLRSNKAPSSAEEEVEQKRRSRMYLLSFSRVSYNRENKDLIPALEGNDDTPPTHRLVLHDLRGAWTKDNKDVCFALFDLFINAQMLKRNLSTEALKGFKMEDTAPQTMSSPLGSMKTDFQRQRRSGSKSSLNKNHAASMLKKLIAESESNPHVVYSEDVESELISDEVKLRGVSGCQDDDVIHKNWLIELINSQVILRGCETKGYVIASAAKCQIWQKIHRPIWKELTLLSKETWVGSVECMQYYATVDARIDSDMVWLGVDNIQEKDQSTVIADLPDLVGCGQSVGGVVSSIVNPSEITPDGSEPFPSTGASVQLQRIISRCGCQFYYVVYTDDIDQDIVKEIPPRIDEDDLLEPWDKEVAVDSFTLMHHELDVSTNSQQFAMIIDLVNNLLLYVEPHRKEAVEKMQNMKFQFQLSSLEEQRGPISLLQDQLRKLIRELKHSERECYRLQRGMEEEPTELLNRELELEKERCEKLKAEINEKSDDLALRITCFKEAQIIADKDRERQEAVASGRFVTSVVKRIEVCFKQASWLLTDADGQLGLADLLLSNFLYTKIAKNDDSVEHSLELGYIRVKNRLPNQAYETVLMPTELKDNIPLDRRRALRIFCRERPPVAGIPVKEHFEVNVVPITIAITKAFFKRMLKFFFPDPEEDEKPIEPPPSRRALLRRRHKKQDTLDVPSDTVSTNSGPASSGHGSASAGSTVASTSKVPEKSLSKIRSQGNDIEIMRERAQKNQTFVYIKIPEVPIRVSYKGSKSKNIEDINNFNLILPTIEYHNQTWTWLDVLMAIKNESQRRLLSQAVKQKLHIRPSFLMSKQILKEEPAEPMSPTAKEIEEEEDRKARLLLGNMAGTVPVTPSKSRLSSFFRK